MARLTIHNGQKLIDPEWGGVYQYSDHLDWLSPHFEKIMFYQAENLRLYSLVYSRWKKPVYLETINDIHRYLNDFLWSSEGAFYTSQDADLNLDIDGQAFFKLSNEKRRSLGIPKIDSSIYSRDNSWMIRALFAMYDATGNELLLDQARKVAHFIRQYRALKNGGFSHGENDIAGPYPGGNQAMAQAFISLHQRTTLV